MRRHWLMINIAIILVVLVFPVHAHANLERSEPFENARLAQAPPEIRLFFTEPLEAQFSQIELRNAEGETLDLAEAQLDPDDDKQLILIPGELPDGIYLVAWHVVSQTDGHLTQGSFPITVGDGNFNGEDLVTVNEDNIPWFSSMIRWLNLFSLAWLVGSVAFWLFIWFPSVVESYPALEKRLHDFVWLAWISVGASTALILLLQAQIISDGGGVGLLDVIPQIMTETRFGNLWVARVLLWAGFGFVLWGSRRVSYEVSVVLLLIGMAILITQSSFSHASGAEDSGPSVVADWMHLLAMAIWIGSLIQFVLAISVIRETKRLAVMVARFSNMARVCVATLIVTGSYAAWLQVGSFDALLHTSYGQALGVKLGLFLPLLAIGGINLIYTDRGLRTDSNIWTTRLRYLVGAEIALTIAILFAVGIMTAIVPARITAAANDRANAVPIIADNSFFEMVIDDDLMTHFTIEPGTVGENKFLVDLYDLDTNTQIEDASLIRLRFESEDGGVGESELRIESSTNRRYVVSGANLSSAGTWRIRMTIQRPDEFDSVIDFSPQVSLPTTTSAPFNPGPDVQSRSSTLMLAGLVGVFACIYFVVFVRPVAFNAQTALTIIFAIGSFFLLQSGIRLKTSEGGIGGMINPIPVNEQTLALGEEIFMQNCSPCHGLTGLGDGPVGLALDPPPANLTIHTAPGLHTDAELFTWISNGVSSTSAMPAFSGTLTEDERWTVVNFIRTFGQVDQP